MADDRGLAAVVVTGPGDVGLQTRAAKRLGPSEARVRVLYAGICHTDHYILNGGHSGARYPVVPGHEFSGVVTEIGASTATVRPGDVVAVMSTLPCARCEPCLGEQGAWCERLRQFGTVEDGGWQEELVLPEASLIALAGSGLSAAEGALLEPAANGVAAVRSARLSRADHVVVIGAGAIGQCTAQAARAAGAASVSVLGLPHDSARLAMAKSLGATAALTVQPDLPADTEARRLKTLLPGGRADVVVDCAGAIAATRLALALVGDGGRVIVEGFSGDMSRTVEVSPDEFTVRRLALIGVNGWTPSDYHEAVRLATRGDLRLGPLITHTFGLEDFRAAVDLCASYGDGVVRALLQPTAAAAEGE